jgi:hypothetical protein
MAQSAIAGKGAILAHRRTISPNASFQCNRSRAGCPLAHRPQVSVLVENRFLTVAALIHRTGLI